MITKEDVKKAISSITPFEVLDDGFKKEKSTYKEEIAEAIMQLLQKHQ